MNRTLLALCLALCASGALAAEPLPPEEHPADCPQAEATQAKPQAGEREATTRRPGTTQPVRAQSGSGGAAGRGTPRWNSLLPGMFR